MAVKTISGYVDVAEADRADFALALPQHSRLTNAEGGCLYFRVTPHDTIAGRYNVEEAFDDEAAYQLHIERTRTTEWFGITKNISRNYQTNNSASL